jgi:hypothetical protein
VRWSFTPKVCLILQWLLEWFVSLVREFADVIIAPESFSAEVGSGRSGRRHGQMIDFSRSQREGGSSVELRVSVMASGYFICIILVRIEIMFYQFEKRL